MKNAHYSECFDIIILREQKRSGDVTSIPEHGRTTLEVAGVNTVRIPLTQGKYAIVDECDVALVSGRKWAACWNGWTWYASATVNNTTLYMHRLIMDAPKGMKVDHKNHDGIDNRRENLRICTNSQNIQNRRGPRKNSSSGFIGVYPERGRFRARITVNGKTISVGRFDTPEEAARARDRASRTHYGEFASLNFPEEGDA